MGNLNAPILADNNEVWDYSNLYCCVNPVIDPLSFQRSSGENQCGIPVLESNNPHSYLLYKDYCWIYLAAPENKWATAGLFPRRQFKKLLKRDPIYQIPNNPDYHLSKLCREVVNDTYTIYQILRRHGISVVDLVPFQYKYTQKEKEEYSRGITNSIKSISENLDILTQFESKGASESQLSDILTKLERKVASQGRPSVQDPVSQTSLLQCLAERARSETDIQSSLNFMKSYTPSQQWGLCRERIFEMRDHITKIIKKENWPCHFGDDEKTHQMFFNKYKPSFGSDRIAISIAPDTYTCLYMETALLRIGTRDFLDKYDYQNQETREWKTLETLIGELRRLVGIYNDS